MSFSPLRIHQNRCRLRLCPRPCLGTYSAPRSPKLVSRGPLRGRRGTEGREGRTRGREDRKREREEWGREGTGGSWGNIALVVEG